MSKKYIVKKIKENLGFVTMAVGIGIIVTIVLPIWGWIIVVGVTLIYVGWYLIQNHK